MRINEAYSSLIDTYNDWSDILVNISYIRKNQIISWIAYEPQRLPDIVRLSDVQVLEKTKQYSFQIVDDGSILQLFYQYRRDNVTLSNAALSYYSTLTPQESLEEADPSLEEIFSAVSSPGESELPDFNIKVDDDPLVPWIRIDFSPQSNRHLLHHTCHMHISLLEHARIPLSGVPSPRQFIEFIIALFYPEHYRSHRLDSYGNPSDLNRLRAFNDLCFPPTVGDVFSILPYIRIPTR